MLKQLLLCILLVSIITDAKLTVNKFKGLKKNIMKRALNFKHTLAYRKGTDCDSDLEDCSDVDSEELGEDEYDLDLTLSDSDFDGDADEDDYW